MLKTEVFLRRLTDHSIVYTPKIQNIDLGENAVEQHLRTLFAREAERYIM